MPTNTAPAGWKTLQLNDGEREMLGRFATDTMSDPYDNLPQFRIETSRAAAELSATTRAAVSAIADGTSDLPALYIDNLPEPSSLPPTPITVEGWTRTTRDTLSEFLMLVFTEGLGHPISYLDQRNGKIFHDIYPTADNAAAVSSQSFKVGLGFHTEMFFHPEPPDFLLLHCLRPDPAGIATTSVAAVDDIDECLSPEHRDMLRQNRYAIDIASLHGRYVHVGRSITERDPRPVVPIVSGGFDTRFRFEPALTTPLDRQAAGALDAAEHAAHAVAVSGSLKQGAMLIVDNRRSAHARNGFPANLDGSDRWLRRMMVSTGSGSTDRHGAVLRHDLELINPWRHQAPIAAVPYTSKELLR